MAVTATSSPLSTSDTISDITPTHTRLLFHLDDIITLAILYMFTILILQGSSLVYHPFDGTCYGSWRRSVLVAFSIRNKLYFIHGTIEKPPKGSPLMRQQKRCNDLVIAQLSNSVTKQIHRTVVYSEYTKDIWQKLETSYGQADVVRVFELKKELAHISQGALDNSSYFKKIKQPQDELASISESKCIYGGGVKAEEEQYVYQFLMWMNDVYVQVRNNNYAKALPLYRYYVHHSTK